jgi:hypothetical protein
MQTISENRRPAGQIARSILGVSPFRSQYDFYPTPAYVTRALLEREEFTGTVWECASGNGAMSRVLEEELPHCKVVSSTIEEKGYGEGGVDFLRTFRTVDAIITNPPFCLAQEFVEHALECATSKVAMFLRVTFLEGVRRYYLYQRTPPETVYVFSRRVNFDEGCPQEEEQHKKNPVICFCWYVWRKGYVGKPQLDFILTDDEEDQSR